MTDNLQTEPKLLAALENAIRHRMTDDERRRQRTSFIIGGLPADSVMTHEQVEEILAGQRHHEVMA